MVSLTNDLLATVGQHYRLTLPLGTKIEVEPLISLLPKDFNMRLEKHA